MPPDPPSLPCLCMHTYTSDTNVTPLLKNLATGLIQYLLDCMHVPTHNSMQLSRFKGKPVVTDLKCETAEKRLAQKGQS